MSNEISQAGTLPEAGHDERRCGHAGRISSVSSSDYGVAQPMECIGLAAVAKLQHGKARRGEARRGELAEEFF